MQSRGEELVRGLKLCLQAAMKKFHEVGTYITVSIVWIMLEYMFCSLVIELLPLFRSMAHCLRRSLCIVMAWEMVT